MSFSQKIIAFRAAREMTHQAFADAVGVSRGAVQQWESGATAPKRANQPAVAKFMGISVAELMTETNPPLGVSEPERPNYTFAQHRGSVPLISPVRAGSWGQINDHIPDTDRRVDVRYSKPSSHAFALEVEGDSMVGTNGHSFPAGTVIVVDPERGAKPGDYVVAKDVATQKGTFKKLMSDGSRWYLKPLNSDYPILEIDDPAHRVIGVVIEYWNGGKL